MSIQLIKSRQIAAGRRTGPFGALTQVTGLMWLAAMILLQAPEAGAVRVTSIYAAEAELDTRGEGLDRAFDTALGKVLVKVSGLPALGNDAARKSLVPDARELVLKHARLPDGRVRVEFYGARLRQILDDAGQPVWGDDRPLVAIWYAVDDGSGKRQILQSSDMLEFAAEADLLRASLDTVADERGLPMMFPLLDAEDLRNVNFADLWGDFHEPIFAASSRYGAEVILIARARSLSAEEPRVRWTIATATEQYAWEGFAADGPAMAAEFLAQRLGTYADSSGALRVVVSGVDTLDKFGQLRNYLRSLTVIESRTIARINNDRIEFDLIVRGDVESLALVLDKARLLTRSTTSRLVSISRMPDLVYIWEESR